MKKFVCMMLAAALVFVLAACSGGSSSSADKEYKWGEASFKVKDVTDDAAVVGDGGSGMSGKCVAVVLDFGDDTISQTVFESNVSKGMLTLAGQKPKNYTYHMSNMVMESSGFVAQLTGEMKLFFDMDSGYEVNKSDLEIKE